MATNQVRRWCEVSPGLLTDSATQHVSERRSTCMSTASAAMSEPLLVSVQEAAKLLGVGRTTVYSLITTGGVEAVHIGRRCLIVYESLLTYRDRLRGRD